MDNITEEEEIGSCVVVCIEVENEVACDDDMVSDILSMHSVEMVTDD